MSGQTVKMLVFGELRCGKTELIKKILNPHALFASAYNPTIMVNDLAKEAGDYHYQIWDASGDTKYDRIVSHYMKDIDLGLLCIDLSVPVLNIDRMRQCLAMVQAHQPDMAVIVVGTRYDLALPGAIQAFEELQSETVRGYCRTSAQNNDGITNLCTMMKQVLNPQNPQNGMILQDMSTLHDPLATAISLAGSNGHPSLLLEKLQELEEVLKQVSDKKKRVQIAQEAETLIRALQNPSEDKANAITDFEQNCRLCLHGHDSWIKNTLKVVLALAVTACVFVLAATVGFGIGFALGAWTGPGAFFSGLAGGIGAGVIAASAVLGVMGGALVVFGLFGTYGENKRIQNAVDSVANMANDGSFV